MRWKQAIPLVAVAVLASWGAASQVLLGATSRGASIKLLESPTGTVGWAPVETGRAPTGAASGGLRISHQPAATASQGTPAPPMLSHEEGVQRRLALEHAYAEQLDNVIGVEPHDSSWEREVSGEFMVVLDEAGTRGVMVEGTRCGSSVCRLSLVINGDADVDTLREAVLSGRYDVFSGGGTAMQTNFGEAGPRRFAVYVGRPGHRFPLATTDAYAP